jgi:hypothetical protein
MRSICFSPKPRRADVHQTINTLWGFAIPQETPPTSAPSGAAQSALTAKVRWPHRSRRSVSIDRKLLANAVTAFVFG